MPILDWIGKKQVINHDKELPFRLLKRVDSLSVGKSENLIIKGDNLEALKALMPYYYNKVKCIYIDPPYNTGSEDWAYNDKVNSPEIQKWLRKVVDREDLSRHDKWLCMIYPRLKLLRELMADNGVIFISCDDNELYNLRLLLNEIFQENNWVGTIVWKNVTDNNPTNIAIEHEYIICYSKNKKNLERVWKSRISDAKEILIKVGKEHNKKHIDPIELQDAYTKWFKENKKYLGQLDRYKYIDKKGVYIGSQSVHNPGREGYRYDVIHPKTKKPCKQPLMGYRFPKSTVQKLLEQRKILFGKDENKIIELKVYVEEFEDKLASIIQLDGRLGSYDLKEIFPEVTKAFDNPKPVQLLKQILSYLTSDTDIVLDSFAGSGTTAHAVLGLNNEDKGNRKFILIEMEKNIAKKITAERVKRVIKGYSYKNNKDKEIKAKGLGGGFQFMNLNNELFDAHGLIHDDVTYTDLARYIFFTETKLDLKEKLIKGHFIGDNNGTEYYLVYKKEKDNVLNEKNIKKLKKTKKQKVVYADNCTLDTDTLKDLNVKFKQIPYEVRGF